MGDEDLGTGLTANTLDVQQTHESHGSQEAQEFPEIHGELNGSPTPTPTQPPRLEFDPVPNSDQGLEPQHWTDEEYEF